MVDGRWIRRLVWRQWWFHRWTHLVLILVAAAGLTFYAFYASWSRASSRTPSLAAAPLNVPESAMLAVSPWQMGFRPDGVRPSLLAQSGAIPQRVGDTYPIWRATVYTPAGALEAWGVSALEPLRAVLEVGPALPALNEGQGLLAAPVATRAGVGVGDVFLLAYWDPLTGLRQVAEVVIAALYTPAGPLAPDLIVTGDLLGSLTGLPHQPNGLILAAASGLDLELIRELELLTRATRQPTRPWDRPEPPGLGPLAVALQGSPVPFSQLVRTEVFYREVPERALRELSTAALIGIWPLVAAVFGAFVVGVTLVLVLMVFDNQEALGIYRVTGFTASQVRVLYACQALLDAAAGSGLGLAMTYGLLPLWLGRYGLNLSLSLHFFVIWAMVVGCLTIWAGRVVTALMLTAEERELLRARASFDWWAIIRY